MSFVWLSLWWQWSGDSIRNRHWEEWATWKRGTRQRALVHQDNSLFAFGFEWLPTQTQIQTYVNRPSVKSVECQGIRRFWNKEHLIYSMRQSCARTMVIHSEQGMSLSWPPALFILCGTTMSCIHTYIKCPWKYTFSFVLALAKGPVETNTIQLQGWTEGSR